MYLLVKVKSLIEVSLVVGFITLRFDFIHEEKEV